MIVPIGFSEAELPEGNPLSFITSRIYVSIGIKLLIGGGLAAASLFVGAACVLLPLNIPFGVIGLAALILLWTMPQLAFVPSSIAKLLIIPFICSVTVIPAYFAIVLHDAPWISARRVVILPFIALAMITISGSQNHRDLLKMRLRSAKLTSIFIMGYIVSQFAALLISVSPASSIGSLTYETLNNIIPMLAFCILIENIADCERIAKTILFCLIASFIVGIFEYHLRHPWLYLALPREVVQEIAAQNPLAPVSASLSVFGGSNYRAVSTYMVPLSWAEFAMMTAPFALHFLLNGSTNLEKVLGGSSLLALVGSIMMAGSRGGYVGFIVDSVVFSMLYVLRLSRRNPRSMIVLLFNYLFGLGTIVVLGSVLFVGRVHNAVLGGGAKAASDQGRHEQWMLAIPRIESRPIFGYGPGTANEIVGWHSPGGLASLDSYVINVLVSSGVIGALFYFLMLLSPLIYAIKASDRASEKTYSLQASFICSIIGYTAYRISLNQTENNSLLFAIIGITVAMVSLVGSEKHAAKRLSNNVVSG